MVWGKAASLIVMVAALLGVSSLVTVFYSKSSLVLPWLINGRCLPMLCPAFFKRGYILHVCILSVAQQGVVDAHA